MENLEKRRTAVIEAANKKVANSKKGDQKKSKQVAQMRKKATSMGLNQDADGQKLGKFSTSGARAGSLLDAHGSQTNQMGQGGGWLNLGTCAAAMFSGGGGDAPLPGEVPRSAGPRKSAGGGAAALRGGVPLARGGGRPAGGRDAERAYRAANRAGRRERAGQVYPGRADASFCGHLLLNNILLI